ncbi:MAG TPA: four helix bundle protein [Acidobacteriaceae bacterium]|nr:four helix bundle protein [Acidobacteriaceae bacterium]
MVKSYKELTVWKRAIELSLAIYRLTANFPIEERYGISSQLQRAGVSIPSNIAEGYGRGTRKDYKQFLAIARGSTLEVQTQLIIANELGYCYLEQLKKTEALSEEVSKMLYALIRKL